MNRCDQMINTALQRLQEARVLAEAQQHIETQGNSLTSGKFRDCVSFFFPTRCMQMKIRLHLTAKKKTECKTTYLDLRASRQLLDVSSQGRSVNHNSSVKRFLADLKQLAVK